MLNGYYETPLVLVSILIAIVAAYSALSLSGRVTESKGRTAVAWTVGGAIAHIAQLAGQRGRAARPAGA